jgi:hypothetical protein
MINSMKKNMITRALAGTALLASFSTLAVVEPITLAFVTVADIEVNQTQPLAFGSSVIGSAGSSCVMNVAVDAGSNATFGTIVDSDIFAGLTGDGCLNVTTAVSEGLAGIYEIVGIADQAVDITIGSATGAGFTFSPRGFATPDHASTAFGTGTTLFNDVATAFTLGDTAAQQGHIVVGGTLAVDVGAPLAANSPFSVVYNITVTY